MALNTTKWDPAAYLENDGDIAAYLQAAYEEAGDDPEFMLSVLGDVARAKKGMSRTAVDAGISRSGLYKATSGEGDPSFKMVHRILGSLGLRLAIVPESAPAPAPVQEVHIGEKYVHMLAGGGFAVRQAPDAILGPALPASGRWVWIDNENDVQAGVRLAIGANSEQLHGIVRMVRGPNTTAIAVESEGRPIRKTAVSGRSEAARRHSKGADDIAH